jgi:hypothetical protein
LFAINRFNSSHCCLVRNGVRFSQLGLGVSGFSAMLREFE